MKAKAKHLVGTLMLAVFVACAINSRKSEAQEKASGANVTTNWVGFLIVGEFESADPIAGSGPFPKGDKSVQLGLRSDGVVVWRKARTN